MRMQWVHCICDVAVMSTISVLVSVRVKRSRVVVSVCMRKWRSSHLSLPPVVLFLLAEELLFLLAEELFRLSDDPDDFCSN